MNSWLDSFKSAPKVAVIIGFLGLAPFFSFTGLSLIQIQLPYVFAHQVLTAYGAVILSFLGGIRWGLAIITINREAIWGQLCFSVIPALLGWIALLLPTTAGLLLLSFAFVLTLFADIHFSAAPYWFKALRLPLSLGAIACLLSSLLL
ncbi:MAG: hypothetical protein CFH41_02829 [Alphaproteobacteria bacterium MarineAlpha11_Bin1]|nr:MAG: hypothetical protein CFH41_02829 [Alphaproteobacteria bacterium MarineAlpha11_Bin1]|tara:strand:+ start:4950 stop:5393 length:444 start_codon:yes stop_codon:yes gene_type:complete